MSPDGEEATTDTPLDLAQHLNSATEHRTSFCEKSDPMVARTVAGSCGSQSGLSISIPLTPTAFAAQSLAARDFMVLQVPDPDYAIASTQEEPLRALSSFESAIDYLNVLGLIDPNRVGIIGFSRTCFYVKYALTHSKYRFGAAAVTDGVDMGYWQYLTLLNVDPSYASQVERFYGAKPFGSGLLAWQTLSPGFGVDRVETPLRIQALQGIGLVWEWEWFAGLRRLGKPVEMVYLPSGIHVLQKPWDRLVSQEGNVDWFDFWLNGREDPDPAKAEQYKRWRELRKLEEENDAKQPAKQ